MVSMSEKGGEVHKEMRKRMIDVCCLQEVRWRGQGTRILKMRGRRYNQWWSEKGHGVGGLIVVNEELCEKLVELRRVSDRVVTVAIHKRM